MAGRSRRTGCGYHEGRLNVPGGTSLRRQGVSLPPPHNSVGHVYFHAGTSTWYTVQAAGRGRWYVCSWIGATCPCDG